MFFAPALEAQGPLSDIPIALTNYHLDDLEISPVDDFDFLFSCQTKSPISISTLISPSSIYFSIRFKNQGSCLVQYRRSAEQSTKVSRKWLGILNIVSALGCHHYQYTSTANERTSPGDLMYFLRARQLCLHQSYLLEHTNLQTIQFKVASRLPTLSETGQQV
jgi:hypothetical protein